MTWHVGKAKQLDENIVEVIRGDGTVNNLLFDLLCAATPHGLENHIVNLLPFKKRGYQDKVGNFIIKIGDKPSTMFSCHMDTVHSVSKEVLRTKACARIWLVTMNDKAPEPEQGVVWGALKEKENGRYVNKFFPFVLGADDKAGVYIMSRMIQANVPGLYVFHVGEEVGGVGSEHIVKNTPSLVEGIKRCVAFDRKGYTDVICFQRGGRCASFEFGDALAKALNNEMRLPNPEYQYKGEAHGTFTDSANYRNLIPECVNLSIGYFDQHSDAERLDVFFLESQLIPALLKINWDALPTVRDPKAVTTSYNDTWRYRGNTYSTNVAKVSPRKVTIMTEGRETPDWDKKLDFPLDCSYEGMLEIISRYFLMSTDSSRDKAKLFIQLLIDKAQLKSELVKAQGALVTAHRLLTNDLNQEIAQESSSLDDDPNNAPVVSEEAQGELELQKSSDLDDSALLWDQEGYPKDENLFNERTIEKMGIVSKFVNNLNKIKFKDNAARGVMDIQQKRYTKTLKYFTDNKGKMNKKGYKTLNSIMNRCVNVIRESGEVQDETLSEAMMDAIAYIERNWYEPGIEVSSRV